MNAAILQNDVSRTLIFYTLIISLMGLSAWIMLPILPALLISLLIYSLSQPLQNKFMRMQLREHHAVIATVLVVFSLGSALVFGLIPFVTEQLSYLNSMMPTLIKNINHLLETALNFAHQRFNFSMEVSELSNTLWQTVVEYGQNSILSSLGLLSQLATTVILVPIITYFLLRDFRGFRNKLMAWLPNREFELGWIIYYRVTQQLQRYVRGVCIQSLVVALVTSIGFFIIGMDMPVIFGLLTGLLNIIPYIGPPLAALPPLLLALGAENPDPQLLIAIPLVILVAQLVDNLVVIPTIIADTVDLHALLVLVGIIIFGSAFGFWGMLVAIPFFATTKILINSLYYGLKGDPG